MGKKHEAIEGLDGSACHWYRQPVDLLGLTAKSAGI